MKTILVPTDFSALSKVAVLYALQLAIKTDANIILLAVINIHDSKKSLLNWKKLEEEMVDTARQDGEQLIREVTSALNSTVPISYRSIIGFPIEEMIDLFAVDNGIDLIVMGTKGATGLKKVLMGSNAVAVINNSSVPVVAVPVDAEFRPVHKIVYPTDMVSLNDEIKTMARVARLFDATICILHVIPSDATIKIDGKKEEEDLIKLTGYPKISFHVSRNDSITKEVDAFVVDQQADMLAMFTHKLDFFENLFGKSVTHQLAFHTKVPMLTFNKTMLK
ncbi:MAG: universal stress protein [Bacteroidota bacterium]